MGTPALDADPLAGGGALVFDRVMCVDFEFIPEPGGPRVVCMSALDALTGEVVELWEEDLHRHRTAPFPTDGRTLVVAFYATAEMGCFEALHWPQPAYLLDLWVERRLETNGGPAPLSLLASAAAYGLTGIATEEKETMRALILAGGPWTAEERRDIQAYCTSDTVVTAALLRAMWPSIAGSEKRLGQALFRGAFMGIASAMEARGIPIDGWMLNELRTHWAELKQALVEEIDRDFGVYDGQTFRRVRFEAYLAGQGLLECWPKHDNGVISLDRKVFAMMAARFPRLEPLRVLRNTLSELKLNDLQPASDGRSHPNPRPFASRTGRSQPSSTESIFGLPKWTRFLIRPEPGTALLYLDYSAQEVGIAAALSGDEKLWQAYETGDVYLAFAKQAGLVPPDGRREDHEEERRRCKAVVLGVQYGQGPHGMAQRAGIPIYVAADLLALHRRTYRAFWAWSDAITDRAMLGCELRTGLGWRIQVPKYADPNMRTYRNWPIQSTGSDILRVACLLLTRAEFQILATVHDAVLLEVAEWREVETREAAIGLLTEAGEIVLGGGRQLRVGCTTARYPSRFEDEDGRDMWNKVLHCLDKERFPLKGGQPQWG